MLLLKPLRPLLLVLCAAATVALPTITQAAPPPAKAFFAPSEFNEVALSPSGNYLAVTTAKLAGRRALYVFDLIGGKPPTQAARIEELDVVDVQWVNDDRLLFSVVNLALGSGSRNHEPSGLFAVNRDGEGLRTLIRRTAAETGGAGGRANERSLSWDHQLLTIPAYQPGERNDTIVIGHVRWNTKGEVASVRPMYMNVNSGVVRGFDNLNSPPGAADWMFDSRGEPRVAVSVDELRGVIHYRMPETGEWKRIGEGSLLELPFTPRFVDDKGTLYVTERRGKDATAVLTRFDLKTGKPEREAVVSTPGFDFLGRPIRQAGSNLLGLDIVTDATQTIWFDPAMKAFQAKVDSLLPGRENIVRCRRCGADDMVALVASSSDREPGEYLIYRAKGDQWQRVGRARPDIKPEQMGRMDFQRIKLRDGLEMPVWLTYPAGHKPGVKPAKPLPTVVLVHGGPNVRGTFWGWSSYAGYTQFLASRGYLVIEPEFRGSDGFGRRYLEAGYKQWGEGMQDDIAESLRWAQQQGIASDKACIAGASYGGYATFAGLMRHPDLYRCGVAWVAVTDLMLLAQGSSWVDTDISVLGRTEILSKRLGDPVADAAMLRATSPVENADKIKAPVLLSMGMADRRVPIAHGNRMRDAMAKAGNPLEYVTYSEEGHSYLKTENKVDWAERMERFLAKHLGQP